MVPLPSLEEMKAAHRLLEEYSYELRPVERGYANRTLYINLDNNSFEERPVTIDEYKSRADRYDTQLHKIIGL